MSAHNMNTDYSSTRLWAIAIPQNFSRLGLECGSLFAARNDRDWIEIRGHVDYLHTFTVFTVFRDHLCETFRLLFAEVVHLRRIVFEVVQSPLPSTLDARAPEPCA